MASPFVADTKEVVGLGKSFIRVAPAHILNSPDTSTLAFWLSAYLRVGYTTE